MTQTAGASENVQAAPKTADREYVRTERPAVVLVNLGTPQEPTPKAIRRFLREFLTDRRVVEMSPFVWRPILEMFILPFRPRAIAPQYRSIWSENGSPLMWWTLKQAEHLHEICGDAVDIHVAMRYGKPSIREVLTNVYSSGTRRVLILPAYPHYSASTVGSIYDEVARWTLVNRDQLEIRRIRSYEADSTYIDALAESLESHWQKNGRPNFEAGERLVTSYHSIPRAMHDAGDPYRYECERTSACLAERLAIPEGGMIVTYQSVFGKAEWIGPSTIETVTDLGGKGCSRLDVICPGFMADCLETLEEIDVLNRQAYLQAGGSDFHYVPWANASSGCVRTLREQVRCGVAGWVNLCREEKTANPQQEISSLVGYSSCEC